MLNNLHDGDPDHCLLRGPNHNQDTTLSKQIQQYNLKHPSKPPAKRGSQLSFYNKGQQSPPISPTIPTINTSSNLNNMNEPTDPNTHDQNDINNNEFMISPIINYLRQHNISNDDGSTHPFIDTPELFYDSMS